MAIDKADILTFVNAKLRLHETDIDGDIIRVLRTLSKYHILKGNDTSLSVSSSDMSLAYPSDALADAQAIISVTLTDSSSDRQAPLKHLLGGWDEYQLQMRSFNDGARSTPHWYVCANRHIYLLPAPDGTYTVDLWYYKRHAKSADAIEFDEDWETAIQFGAAFEVACGHKMKDAMTLWGARFNNEVDDQVMIHSDQVAISGG